MNILWRGGEKNQEEVFKKEKVIQFYHIQILLLLLQ